MRLLPVFLTAAAGVYAASDSSSVEDLILGSLGQISNLTMNVTGEIMQFDGKKLENALPITTQTNVLVAYIQNATMQLKKNPANLTDSGAQTLGAYTQGLAYSVNASIATLIKKKPNFEKFMLDPIVVTSLQMQANVSRAYSGAILAKIPEQLAPVAAAISSQITNSIQQGISCFSKNESCNSNMADPTRTMDAAMDTGAIPKSAGDRTMAVAGWTVVLGAAFVAFATGV